MSRPAVVLPLGFRARLELSAGRNPRQESGRAFAYDPTGNTLLVMITATDSVHLEDADIGTVGLTT